jgi:Mn-dependent DtxR family transcriptional regulator
MPKKASEADAEGMDHYASKATIEAFARFIRFFLATRNR